ncbi:putative RNase H-like nuclease [Parvularcula dongshanensis]|uniref:Putative RNase H-like nuclease n=1 Tax=Parvularcula dongshanensis TaxID=1173995 RepID=A0A840I0V7_9PROT|nr:putative RNase H-like nuclease [Parvularcula dongshanensis]
MFPTLDVLLSDALPRSARVVVIDVPIGLSSDTPRACDRAARLRLGPRRASVFPPPARAALEAASRAEASEIGRALRPGGGVSAQSWNILPKIREADAALSPDDQGRVLEGHPELAFTRLAGAPMAMAKKTKAGADERDAVLRRRGLDPSSLIAAVRARWPKRAVADDDLRDAMVLSLTGLDALSGTAWRLGDGTRDERGLLMEIWG